MINRRSFLASASAFAALPLSTVLASTLGSTPRFEPPKTDFECLDRCGIPLWRSGYSTVRFDFVDGTQQVYLFSKSCVSTAGLYFGTLTIENCSDMNEFYQNAETIHRDLTESGWRGIPRSSMVESVHCETFHRTDLDRGKTQQADRGCVYTPILDDAGCEIKNGHLSEGMSVTMPDPHSGGLVVGLVDSGSIFRNRATATSRGWSGMVRFWLELDPTRAIWVSSGNCSSSRIPQAKRWDRYQPVVEYQ